MFWQAQRQQQGARQAQTRGPAEYTQQRGQGKWTPRDIEQFVGRQPESVVVKHADWCGWCKKMREKCEELGYDIHSEHPNLLFLEEQQLSQAAKPDGWPNVTVYHEGEPEKGSVEDVYVMIERLLHSQPQAYAGAAPGMGAGYPGMGAGAQTKKGEYARQFQTRKW